MAEWFDHIVATDASAAQIANAELHPKVAYRVAPAESSGLPSRSAALVTVAQALHWLNLPAFYTEAQRVLLPGGLIAVWTYGEPSVQGRVDEVLAEFYHNVVGPYWPPERRWVEEGYRTLDFPFEEVPIAAPAMTASWTLPQLLGYIGTWSAVTRYTDAVGSDPLPSLHERLLAHWGPPSQPRQVQWPLTIRAGH